MPKILFKVFSLFPELFPGALNCSITKKALEKKIWDIKAINIRDYATDNHKTVDDVPYGGGAGMLLKPDIIAAAFEANLSNINALNTDAKQDNNNTKTRIIYLSPRGKLFNQEMAREFAKEQEIAILCGRYEGVDQRVINYFNIEEISIGDYVLSGGEIAAYVLIDAILRNVEGVLGAKESLSEESFGSNNLECEYKNLLEYPHYTKPAKWRGLEVPEILLSGHHKKISEWRKQQAIAITNRIRGNN